MVLTIHVVIKEMQDYHVLMFTLSCFCNDSYDD